MFNADSGRQTVTKKIDKLTDRFAAEFEDCMAALSLTEQEKLIKELVKVVSSTDSAQNFATNNTDQPAQALGLGTSRSDSQPAQAPTDAAQALQVILKDPRFESMGTVLHRMVLEMQNPGNPGGLQFDQNGDDVRIEELRKKLSETEKSRDNAVNALKEEQNPKHKGSLAHKLADAEAKASPDGLIAKSEVKAKATEALDKVAAVKESPMKGGKASKLEAETAIKAVVELVS